MMLSIFSNFDDHNHVSLNLFLFLWVFVFIIMILFNRVFFIMSFVRVTFMSLQKLCGELILRSQTKDMGGSFSCLTVIFFLFVGLNLLGIFPYLFSLSSHLTVTLAFSLPIWLGIILASVCFNFPYFLAHFQPEGSPAFLNPFLCVIEFISMIVRPLTLAVRLTANLSTGHILMGLLSVSEVSSSLLICFFILLISSFYCLFEFCVCFIQGYIFTLLPTLYSNDHPH